MPTFRSSRQIENRNYLTRTKFRFTFQRAPKVAFFTTKINVPDMTLGVATQPTYLTDIPLPGEKIEFGDLNIEFLVDEDMQNYFEIQNWIRGISFSDYTAPPEFFSFVRLNAQQLRWFQFYQRR